MSNHYLAAKRSDLPFPHKSMVSIICNKTQLDSIAHEQTSFFSQLFQCWPRALLSANEKKKNAPNDNKYVLDFQNSLEEHLQDCK